MIGEKFGRLTVLERAERPNGAKTKGKYWKVLCDCGNVKVIASQCLKGSHPVRSCGCLKSPSLVGKQFGKGIVIGLSGRNKRGDKIWDLKCECGNEYKAITNSLKSGNTSSCGCLKSGKNSKNYSGHNNLTGDYWGSICRNAKCRGLEVEVTIQQAWDKFVEQDSKCALTGWDIVLSDTGRKKDSSQTASLDRIDSSQGYVAGNIQWVHKDVNRAKTNFSEEYFLEICQSVWENKCQ